MSQIFVLVVIALVLLVAAVVFNTAYQDSGSSAGELDSIVEILGSGLEVGSLIPIVILIALVATVLGVWGRL